MKAVLLCAGEGTRLRPLTFCRPKHLLPVGGRPVLDRVLSALSEAGVDEAIFVVSPVERALQEFVGDGSRWGMSASYCVQSEPKGLAHALGCARGFVSEDERFLMYLGDDLLGDGVKQFVAGFMSSNAAASLIVKPVEDPRAFGVVVVEDGQVARLVEKPKDPPSDLAIVGVYGFGPEIWEAVDSIVPSARGELEITDAIDYLVHHGRCVGYHVTDGFWADAGSPEALLAANEYFLATDAGGVQGEVDYQSTLEGQVSVAADAMVSTSRIIGPCRIGAGAVIEGCTIGPSVAIGDGCTLRGVQIRDSIIDEETLVEDVPTPLERCVLGRRVQLRGLRHTSPGPLTMLLADDSMLGPSNGE